MYLFELIEEEKRAAYEKEQAEYMLSEFLKRAEEACKDPQEFTCLVGGIGSYQHAIEYAERACQRLEQVYKDIGKMLQSIK